MSCKCKRNQLKTATKKPFVFTFKPRRGQEGSSDTDDSDYLPGKPSSDEEEAISVVERKKLGVAQKRLKKIEQSISNRGNESKTCSPVYVPLPPEILQRIFLYGIQSEGITQFLPRVSLVCKDWYSVTSDPCLLKHLDLSVWCGDRKDGCTVSLTTSRVRKLVTFKHLFHCRTLRLAGQEGLTERDVTQILAGTHQLTSLNLQGCRRLRFKALDKLSQLTPNLTAINLNGVIASSNSYEILKRTLIKFGPQLVELRLAGINYYGFDKFRFEVLMQNIIQSCPNLEVLDLSQGKTKTLRSADSASVDTKEMTVAFSQLRELHLDGYSLMDIRGSRSQTNHAFPYLQFYSQNSHICRDHQNAAFYNMFYNNNLTKLDISQTNLHPTRIGRGTFKVLSVKTLNLSCMAWDTEDLPQLSACLSSWHDSIHNLDLSGNKRTWFNSELSSFFSQPENGASVTRLRVINLSNSIVDSQNVLNILNHCKNLQQIDLTACRELPRRCKRVFHSDEFSILIERLYTAQFDS